MKEWNPRLDRLDSPNPKHDSKPLERTDTTINVITQQREIRELRGHTRGLTALVALLWLALAGMGVYGYLTLEKLGVSLDQLPGLQESVTALQERLAAAEQQLASWTADRDKMNQRVNAVEARLNRNLKQANQHAQELTAQLHQRMQAELDQRAQGLEARLENLEIDRKLDRARVEGVEQQVAGLRADTGRDLATLNDSLSRNDRILNELSQQLDRQRVDFELAEDRTQELAPGISLRITSANVSYQRVKGWLWLLSDRRTLWVRDLQAQQALVFYLRGSDTPHELVITQVTKGGVAGYLLLPSNGAAATGAASD
ncbi:MAG: hypothetical protein L0212_09035 [Acidobacteria bacterium]|nr:hypothetical protein [Acidobacteriota bacterium]